MSPFISTKPTEPHPHACNPPTSWPFLSRRRHPTGSIWECDTIVLRTDRAALRGYCGQRWRLRWIMDSVQMTTYPQWESIEPKKPGTPPTGRGGAT